MTFRQFAEDWKAQRGAELVRPKDNDYRLEKISAFVLQGTPPVTFGNKPLLGITTEDIETFKAARKAQGVSPVTVNHDLKLLRKMFNWGIRKGYLKRTPFKVESVNAISLTEKFLATSDSAARKTNRSSSMQPIRICGPCSLLCSTQQRVSVRFCPCNGRT